jgi:hypothetical protein
VPRRVGRVGELDSTLVGTRGTEKEKKDQPWSDHDHSGDSDDSSIVELRCAHLCLPTSAYPSHCGHCGVVRAYGWSGRKTMRDHENTSELPNYVFLVLTCHTSIVNKYECFDQIVI